MLSAAESTALILSLKVGVAAVLGILPLAYLLAFMLARGRFWGHGLLNVIVHLPLVLPPVVTGYLLLLLFGAQGPLGHWLATLGISLIFDWTGAALASAIMALPLMVRAMRLSLEAVDPRLEEAARTLGASRWRVFASITLPLSYAGVIAGLILGFAKSVGEFGATITFVSNIPGHTQTLPLAIYSGLQIPGGEAAVWRLALLSIALSAGALLVSEYMVRRAARKRGVHGL